MTHVEVESLLLEGRAMSRHIGIFVVCWLSLSLHGLSQPPSSQRVDFHGDPLPEAAILRLGSVRFRTEARVRAISVSKDGKLVATASNQVIVWESTTGKRVRCIPESSRALCFTPDGKRLVIAARVIQMYDLATGRIIREFTYGAEALDVSADGKLLASGSWGDEEGRSRSIQIWDLETGKKLSGCSGHEGWIRYVRFSPDGKLLASGGWQNDHSLRLWDVNTGRQLRLLGDKSRRIHGMCFSPDGKFLYAGRALEKLGESTERSIEVWDVATARIVRHYPAAEGGVIELALSPDGKILASSEADYHGLNSSLCLRDLVTGKKLRSVASRNGGFSVLAFSPDGRTVFADSDFIPYGVSAWEAQTGKELFPNQGHDMGVRQVVTSDPCLVTVGWDNTVRWWDAKTGKPLERRFQETDLAAVASSSDGRLLALGSKGKECSIRLVDVTSGQEVCRHKLGAHAVTALTFSPDSETLALAFDDFKSRLCLLDTKTGKLRHRVPGEPNQSFDHLAFSPDGKTLASAGFSILLWDPAKGRKVGALAGRGPFSFTPDSTALAVTGDKYEIITWELSSGKKLWEIPAPAFRTPGLQTLAFSTDGKMLAASYRDRPEIYLWEVLTAKQRRLFHGHLQEIYTLAFANGRTLVSGSQDGTVLVWDPWSSNKENLRDDASSGSRR